MTIIKSQPYKVTQGFISNGVKFVPGMVVYKQDPNFQLNWANDFLMFRTTPDASGNVAVGPVSAKNYLELIPDPNAASTAAPGSTEAETVSTPWYLYLLYAGLIGAVGFFAYKNWSKEWPYKLLILFSAGVVSFKVYDVFLKSQK